jgi:HK97 family phage major capsid protein
VIEGHPIPVGRIDFLAPRTAISKFAVILAMTDELLRMAAPRGLSLIERVSLRALRRGEDTLLLSDDAAVTAGNPAGLLNGLSPVGAGSPTTALADDFSALWDAVTDGDPAAPFFVLSSRGAIYLATLNENGSPLFPNLSPATGGTIYNVPVLLSKAAGANVILIDAARLRSPMKAWKWRRAHKRRCRWTTRRCRVLRQLSRCGKRIPQRSV